MGEDDVVYPEEKKQQEFDRLYLEYLRKKEMDRIKCGEQNKFCDCWRENRCPHCGKLYGPGGCY